MDSLRRVLLWEIIRIDPQILFTLLTVSKQLHEQLSSDISYIQYFWEEIYNHECRQDTYKETLDWLQQVLQRGSPILFYLAPTLDVNFISYDFSKGKKSLHKIDAFNSENIFDLEFMAWTPYGQSNVFFCGGHSVNQGSVTLPHTFTYSMSTGNYKKLKNMLLSRHSHGLIYYKQAFYVFCGIHKGFIMMEGILSEKFGRKYEDWEALAAPTCAISS